MVIPPHRQCRCHLDHFRRCSASRDGGHTGYLPARRLGLACAAPPGTAIRNRSKDPVSLHSGTTRTDGVSSVGTLLKEMETGNFSTAILRLREGCFRMPRSSISGSEELCCLRHPQHPLYPGSGRSGAQPYEVPTCSTAGPSQNMHLSPCRAVQSTLCGSTTSLSKCDAPHACKSCTVLDVEHPSLPPLQCSYTARSSVTDSRIHECRSVIRKAVPPEHLPPDRITDRPSPDRLRSFANQHRIHPESGYAMSWAVAICMSPQAWTRFGHSVGDFSTRRGYRGPRREVAVKLMINMWGTEREQPRPSPTRRCAWQNTCANVTVQRVGVGLKTGAAEFLVCKTDSQDRRLYLIEPSVCVLLGDLRTRGQRVHTMECVFRVCLDAQVHPIQGAALELSVPF